MLNLKTLNSTSIPSSILRGRKRQKYLI